MPWRLRRWQRSGVEVRHTLLYHNAAGSALPAAHLYNTRLRFVPTLLMGIARSMALKTTYQFLEPRAESNYRQLFVRGRSLRAETLYRASIGAEPRTPEEVAADFGVPLAAVHEAVHYGLHNEELLRQEREAVLADMRDRGLDKPPYVPVNGTPRA